MKQLLVSISAFILSFNHLQAQCPTAAVVLSTQAEVNAFPTTYAGCTILPDGVDLEIMGNDITDLTPLSQITSIQGILEIRDCATLTNLNGLNNLSIVGNDPLDGFIMRDLPLLNDISALNSLTTVHGEFTIRTCNSLTTLNGLNNVDTANGSLIIRDNALLQNLNGLNSLIHIGETLELVQNPVLTDISALSNVNSIVGGPEGGIFIEANTALTNLTGLGNNNTTVGGNLDLLLNDNLSLCSVPSICNYLANPPVGAIITINTNITGCNTQAEIQAGCVALSAEENADNNNFTVYPNPANDMIYINSSNTNDQIELRNVYGQLIKQVKITSNKTELNISDLSPGIYYIKTSAQNALNRFVKL
ncbi:MAG: T9SS type A sorting domain-containing protein [Bacteroidia bacterium]|nr:T9SS type A sorting domain-containing protein [Bacteroidia bacterium]